jgi:4-diphosphocytidyl-2-C-methyl-D-erythritol kinase
VRRALTLHPTAKINLTLRVGASLSSGYHEVRTVMQSIGLSDALTFTARSGPFVVQSRAPGLATGDTNLVNRAAAALWGAAGKSGPMRDVHVKLDKSIPIAAGLGGGSADAAAALVGLNEIWELRQSVRDLVRIAATLGADVPFFLHGGTAIGVGRGEEVYPLEDIKRFGVIVLKPSFGVSTADAYRWCDEDRTARAGVEHRDDVRNVDVGWPAALLGVVNDLEAPVARRHPAIAEMIAACTNEGAIVSAMTGSGSAVFGLFRETVAGQAAKRLKRPDWLVFLTRTVSRREASRRIGL